VGINVRKMKQLALAVKGLLPICFQYVNLQIVVVLIQIVIKTMSRVGVHAKERQPHVLQIGALGGLQQVILSVRISLLSVIKNNVLPFVIPKVFVRP